MQKAPVMKGSGLLPPEEKESDKEVHVFGSNLEERVVTREEEEQPPISFSSSQSNNDEDDIVSIRKRKFDAITGEEDEETIFQGDFKLFIWDLGTSNWTEKGRGQLKLNDSIDQDEKKSRLIMRVNGTHRIILNVAVNCSFFKVIANSKNNIRFTDSQTLWAASGSNAHQLRDLIDERLKDMEDKSSESSGQKKLNLDDETPSKKTKADLEKDEHEDVDEEEHEGKDEECEKQEGTDDSKDSLPADEGDIKSNGEEKPIDSKKDDEER